MTQLEKELEHNHQRFLADWTSEAQKNWAALSASPLLAASYRRLSCMNGLQHTLLTPARFSAGSAAFFLEAQNDALVSHVNANVGGWRAALQSLRSCIENTLCAIYYSDHPVELELWVRGEDRMTFTALHTYMQRHPRLSTLGPVLTGLDILKAEYGTLSKAVHGSAASFRMTDGVSRILLWSPDDAKLGAWSTRERKVLEGIASLLVCLFASEFQGAKNSGLRTMLSFVMPQGRRKSLKEALNVNISAPT